MDGLLSRAGFVIKSKNIQDGVIGTYYCTKPIEVATMRFDNVGHYVQEEKGSDLCPIIEDFLTEHEH